MSEPVGQPRTEVAITRAGLVCSLGRNPRQAALLLRAGHTTLRRTPFGTGHRVHRMCQLWDLPETCVGFERLLRLAVPALHQVLAAPFTPLAQYEQQAGPQRGAAATAATPAPVPLLLALPPDGRADDDADAADHFAAALSEAVGVRLDAELSVTLRGGHASGVRLLERAMERIARGEASRVVVGGVDGYYHPALLQALDDADRLFGSDTPEGFLPGEAAGFVLLERPAPAEATGSDASTTAEADGCEDATTVRSPAHLCWAASKRIPDEVLAALIQDGEEDEDGEPADTQESTEAKTPSDAARAARRAQTRLRLALSRLTGGGARARAWWRRRRTRRARARTQAEREALPEVTGTMVELVQGAAKAYPDLRPDWVLTDLNHAPERTEQWSTVMIQALPQDVRCDHYVHQLGDVGAATAPSLVALACAQWQLGCAPATHALIAAHSNDAERGVLLLRGPT